MAANSFQSSTPMDVQFSTISASSMLRPLPPSSVAFHGPEPPVHYQQLQQLAPSHMPPSTTAAAADLAALSQSASRKRMRPSQWDGSTMAPEIVQHASLPISLLHSSHVPPAPESSSNAQFPDSMHIHTCLENIQASLKSLHAMQFAIPQATSTPNSFPTGPYATTPPTPLTSSAAAAAAAAAACAPTPNDYSPDGQQHDHSGSDPESSPHASTSRFPSSRTSPESFRKSKQRVFEKHRRDELKKQMELLSSLIKFSNPTNKIGVVMAAITYVREQQTSAESLRNNVKNLEVQLTESQTKLREFQIPHRPHSGSTLCDVRLSSALSTSPTFLMTKYQALLEQFQQMQFNYSQLAKSQQASCATAAAFSPTGFPRVMESKGEISPPPAAPMIQSSNLTDSYPFSPIDYNAASAFNPHAEFPENDTPTPYRTLASNKAPDTPVAHTQIPLAGPAQRLTSGSDSGFTTALLFNSETTARLLTRDGIIMEISPKMLRDLGFERHELIGKPLTDITPSIKQPMTRLNAATEDHEAEPLAILDSFKTKQGGITFLSGLLEVVWDEAKCPGKSGQHVGGGCGGGAGGRASSGSATNTTQEPMAYSSTASGGGGASGENEDPLEAMSVNPGFCNTSNQNVNHFYFHPCGTCGERPRYGVFTGLPTYHTDMEEHITMSVKNVVRLFDPNIQREGLQIDEFFTRGKVSYEATQNPAAAGSTRTMRVTKFLPMPFVQGRSQTEHFRLSVLTMAQIPYSALSFMCVFGFLCIMCAACSVYLNMARTAFATKSNPPRIQL